jgi:hypothetical protein
MTYRVNRALGYQKWGVTNPWVWANYGQPQRHRGYVSPMVFQTKEPFLQSAHLGAAVDELTVAQAESVSALEERKRAERMEKMAVAGLILSGASLLLLYHRTRK